MYYSLNSVLKLGKTFEHFNNVGPRVDSINTSSFVRCFSICGKKLPFIWKKSNREIVANWLDRLLSAPRDSRWVVQRRIDLLDADWPPDDIGISTNSASLPMMLPVKDTRKQSSILSDLGNIIRVKYGVALQYNFLRTNESPGTSSYMELGGVESVKRKLFCTHGFSRMASRDSRRTSWSMTIRGPGAVPKRSCK
jgi:hypothetical protein